MENRGYVYEAGSLHPPLHGIWGMELRFPGVGSKHHYPVSQLVPGPESQDLSGASRLQKCSETEPSHQILGKEIRERGIWRNVEGQEKEPDRKNRCLRTNILWVRKLESVLPARWGGTGTHSLTQEAEVRCVCVCHEPRSWSQPGRHTRHTKIQILKT